MLSNQDTGWTTIFNRDKLPLFGNLNHDPNHKNIIKLNYIKFPLPDSNQWPPGCDHSDPEALPSELGAFLYFDVSKKHLNRDAKMNGRNLFQPINLTTINRSWNTVYSLRLRISWKLIFFMFYRSKMWKSKEVWLKWLVARLHTFTFVASKEYDWKIWRHKRQV